MLWKAKLILKSNENIANIKTNYKALIHLSTHTHPCAFTFGSIANLFFIL